MKKMSMKTCGSSNRRTIPDQRMIMWAKQRPHIGRSGWTSAAGLGLSFLPVPRCDPSARRDRGLPRLAFMPGQIRALVQIFLAAGKPPAHTGLRGTPGQGSEDRLTVI